MNTEVRRSIFVVLMGSDVNPSRSFRTEMYMRWRLTVGGWWVLVDRTTSTHARGLII